MKQTYEFSTPVWNNYFAGALLTMFGIAPFLFLYENFLFWFSFPEIIVIILYSVILYSGISYLNNAHHNIKLKITPHKVMYRKQATNKAEAFYTNFGLNTDWLSVPLRDITKAEFVSNMLWGNYIKLTLVEDKELILRGVNALSKKDKCKIVEILKVRIARKKANKQRKSI